MHPILFEIPLSWMTVAIVGVLFAFGGLVRTRFVAADKDASYLATFLGLNVQWGVVANPWGKSVQGAFTTGLSAAAVTAGIKYVAALPQFHTDKIPLHIYGLMMATAFILGIYLATREAAHEKLPSVALLDSRGKQYVDKDGNKVFMSASDLVSDLGFYLLVSGLAGSRILYIFTRWKEEYASDPMRVFKIWEGGLVWYGGLIGATLVAWWFVRKHKIAFLPYADVLVPGVALGHGIGRLGCFAAGCCFGNVAMPNFPFTVEFPKDSPAFIEHLQGGLIKAAAEHSLPVYPTQIIEAAGELIIFCILLFIRSKKRFHGQALLSYFFLYPILRTIIEMFRGDSIRAFFFRWPTDKAPLLLSTSQGVSLLVATVGFILMVVLVRARSRGAQAVAA